MTERPSNRRTRAAPGFLSELALASPSAPCAETCASTRARSSQTGRSLVVGGRPACAATSPPLLGFRCPLHRHHCLRPLQACCHTFGGRRTPTHPVAPFGFRTRSTRCSATSLRACFVPLAIMGFAALPSECRSGAKLPRPQFASVQTFPRRVHPSEYLQLPAGGPCHHGPVPSCCSAARQATLPSARGLQAGVRSAVDAPLRADRATGFTHPVGHLPATR